MSDSRRQGNIVLISIAVLVLFAVSNMMADPAAGAVVASTELTTRTDDGSWEIVAKPIEPVRDYTAAGGRLHGYWNSCFVDFNESSVLASLPGNAIDSFVYWPFWNQYCPQGSDHAVSVQPVGYSHYHLGYVDTTIRWCLDLETFGRPVDPDDPVSDCTAIDPLTEPRSGIQPHVEDFSIRILAYDTQTSDRLHFDLNQIRILSGQAEVCFVKTALPWIAAVPTDDPPGYCGDLGPGTWDVSASVVDAYEVRIYARSANMSFTDLGIKIG